MRNLLEPSAFVELFYAHPPKGFACVRDAAGLPLFFTDFDLLTTLDPAMRARLARLPFAAGVLRRLYFPACFAGSTITEYAPLPEGATPEEEVEGLLHRQGDAQPLTIIKDLPEASPLLCEEDNLHANDLVRAATKRGFLALEGQALAYLPLDFSNLEDYFARLSAGRRKDLRRKMRTRDALEVDLLPLGDHRFRDAPFLAELYAMYLEVYEQSRIHFDLLTPSFFSALLNSEEIRGLVICYRHRGLLAGYNICLLHKGLFIDKYIGFRYPKARELNLYFVSWLVNLEIALQRGCSVYVAGWTDPEVKAALGAKFTFTRHLVWVRSPFLRRALAPLRPLFESDGRAVRQREGE